MTEARKGRGLPAPAKINLHLRVTGLAEDGRHTLDTSFMFVDARDELLVRPADELIVRCTMPELEGPANLVWRALDAMRKRHDIARGLEVTVRKRLPLQAGLGGGSSDAATAMLAANALWGLNRRIEDLIDLAAPLGADIPCFLYGRASLARGVGERLSPLETELDGRPVLLAHPGVGLSTARVFAEFDRLRLTPSMGADTIRAGSSRDETDSDFAKDSDTSPQMSESSGIGFRIGQNDLEPVAAAMCPPLAALLDRMRARAGRAWMSGSGTTCVALAGSRGKARELARELERDGLAAWTHAGRLLAIHPLRATGPETEDWGVAKR